jgi:hypothetical protein
MTCPGVGILPELLVAIVYFLMNKFMVRTENGLLMTV